MRVSPEYLQSAAHAHRLVVLYLKSGNSQTGLPLKAFELAAGVLWTFAKFKRADLRTYSYLPSDFRVPTYNIDNA
jgi:hypothetical protein